MSPSAYLNDDWITELMFFNGVREENIQFFRSVLDIYCSCLESGKSVDDRNTTYHASSTLLVARYLNIYIYNGESKQRISTRC